MKNEATHARFVKYLKESRDAVMLVAQMFYLKGCDIRLIHPTIAENPDQWQEHADEGDLYVRCVDYPDFMRIEVKCLTTEFTSADDWPHKRGFMVCNQHSFDMANPKPHAYVILNPKKTHAGIVAVPQTRDKWWVVKNIKDNRYPEDVRQDFYFIKPEHVRFTKL